MNDPNQKSSADFGQWQNEQSPKKFNQMLSRGGGTAYKPQGITPPGPNHSPQWFNGPGQEMTKFGDPSSRYGGWPNKWGNGGSREMDPKHPMGPGQFERPAPPPAWHGDPFQNRPNPYDPGGQLSARLPIEDSRYPINPVGQLAPDWGGGPAPFFNNTGSYQLPPNPNRPMQAQFGGGEMSPMQRSLMARRPQQPPIPDPRFPDPGATLPIESPIDQGPGLANQYGIIPFQWRM